MSTKDKLLERFLSLPKDFTFEEAERLFRTFGFEVDNKGHTSGSRVEFISYDGEKSYIMHKPHPSNILKVYVLKQMMSFFKEQKFI